MSKTIEHDYKKEIEIIMGNMECSEDFACLQSVQYPHCKVKGLKLENAVEVDGNGRSCKFLVSYGDTYYCKCPLNVYLTKNLLRENVSL